MREERSPAERLLQAKQDDSGDDTECRLQ